MGSSLQLNSVIGFEGSIQDGLISHPDGRTIIYPLGSTIVLRDKYDARAQEFLQGHSDKVRERCSALGEGRGVAHVDA